LTLSQSTSKSITFNLYGSVSQHAPKMFQCLIGIEKYWRNA